MTTEQLALHNKAFELALKYGFTLDDEVNFLWHDDPELGQELYYYASFDADTNAIIEEANIPVFLSISKDYIRFDVDSGIAAGVRGHDKFNKSTVKRAVAYIAENYCY